MGRQTTRIIFSLLIIALGVVFLLNNLGILPFDLGSNLIWLALFGVGGLAFLAVFAGSPRDNWWAAIPGFTLAGLGVLLALPPRWEELGGMIFLGAIGVSFLVIYLVRREFWWAIIPGGVLVTLSLVTLTSAEGDGSLGGAVLFLGIAATFLAVYWLPTAVGRMKWALWPAGIMGLMGVLLMAGAGGVWRFAWPVLLILGGGYLVLRTLGKGTDQ